MADSDTSFHEGNTNPDTSQSYGWSADGDADDNYKGQNSFAHPDTPFPPANPVEFQDNKQ